MNPAGQPAGQPAQPRAVGSGRHWVELREALGELWEGLYIQKLPINRPSGRYVNIGDTTNKNIPVYSQSVDTMY